MDKAPATLPVTFDDVEAAHELLRDVAENTPVVSSSTFNLRVGAEVYFKCENFQRTGAFKIRGAYNALANLSNSACEGGVLAYSSGNHAQAVALAGQLLNISTTIIMPEDAPSVKLDATKGYGAEVILYDRNTRKREALAREIAEKHDLTIIPPYDHPDIIAGQGTAAVELFQEAGDLDVLVVCCGGGGLLSGSAISARQLAPMCHVVGVEPKAGDDATRSFYSGELQTVENPDTIADGARTPYLGEYTYPLVMSLVDEMTTVSDKQLVQAMHFLWQRMKLVVEPTGALGAAALLSEQLNVSGKQVGVLITGGNVDISRAAKLFAEFGV